MTMVTEDATGQKFIQARVSADLHRQVETVAREERRSVSNWVQVTLEQAVRQQKMKHKRQQDDDEE
jgi:predicted HicB family RNase H-like nuclease